MGGKFPKFRPPEQNNHYKFGGIDELKDQLIHLLEMVQIYCLSRNLCLTLSSSIALIDTHPA